MGVFLHDPHYHVVVVAFQGAFGLLPWQQLLCALGFGAGMGEQPSFRHSISRIAPLQNYSAAACIYPRPLVVILLRCVVRNYPVRWIWDVGFGYDGDASLWLGSGPVGSRRRALSTGPCSWRRKHWQEAWWLWASSMPCTWDTVH